jgi:hypothetical protein
MLTALTPFSNRAKSPAGDHCDCSGCRMRIAPGSTGWGLACGELNGCFEELTIRGTQISLCFGWDSAHGGMIEPAGPVGSARPAASALQTHPKALMKYTRWVLSSAIADCSIDVIGPNKVASVGQQGCPRCLISSFAILQRFIGDVSMLESLSHRFALRAVASRTCRARRTTEKVCGTHSQSP